MGVVRSYALTIAGFDPSAGAGVLADVKTFEQHKVYGLGVNTANTVQHESEFKSVNWVDESIVFDQLDCLLNKYPVQVIKVGLIKDASWLKEIRKRTEKTKIVWDPVLATSTGFDIGHDRKSVLDHLTYVDVVTPNWEEIQRISGHADGLESARELSAYCAVYLKGGHHPEHPGKDWFIRNGVEKSFQPKKKNLTPKHGSGCVFSSALAANLALGRTWHKSCLAAKRYTTNLLASNFSLLGYHK